MVAVHVQLQMMGGERGVIDTRGEKNELRIDKVAGMTAESFGQQAQELGEQGIINRVWRVQRSKLV
jgi:hypothetical protein